METDIQTFLMQYKNCKIDYIANYGNAGDSLIAYATLQLFDKLGIDYEVHDIKKSPKFEKSLLFYSGGGYLTDIYDHMDDHLLNNVENNECVLLPMSINDKVDIIETLLLNKTTILCRELYSYKYLKQFRNSKNIYLCEDLALGCNLPAYTKCESSPDLSTLTAFRRDGETSSHFGCVSDNFDIMKTLVSDYDTQHTTEKDAIYDVVKSLVGLVSNYDLVYTDRLHLGILCAVMNIRVNLFANNYYKIKGVFEYSLERVPCVNFLNINS
jgi:exopolysaccharide biosynthesis predicted pyruvyltransferase EpsI